MKHIDHFLTPSQQTLFMCPQALFTYHCRRFGVRVDDTIHLRLHTTIFKAVSLAFFSLLHTTKLYFVHKVTKTCCWMLKADTHHIVIATYSCNSVFGQFISSAVYHQMFYRSWTNDQTNPYQMLLYFTL